MFFCEWVVWNNSLIVFFMSEFFKKKLTHKKTNEWVFLKLTHQKNIWVFKKLTRLENTVSFFIRTHLSIFHWVSFKTKTDSSFLMSEFLNSLSFFHEWVFWKSTHSFFYTEWGLKKKLTHLFLMSEFFLKNWVEFFDEWVFKTHCEFFFLRVSFFSLTTSFFRLASELKILNDGLSSFCFTQP